MRGREHDLLDQTIRRTHPLGRADSSILASALMAMSGLALLGPMGLAALYALGSFEGVARIEIATMLRHDGAVNALGFAVPGLLSWHLGPSGGEKVDR